MFKLAATKLAPAIAVVSLLGAVAASPSDAFLSRPCSQTGPQIWLTSSGISGDCLSPGDTIWMNYSATDAIPPYFTWGYGLGVTASPTGTITNVALKEPPALASPQTETIDAYDSGSNRESNTFTLTIPAT